MPTRPTSDFADLALHALAHLPLPDHTSVHDPRYVMWAAELGLTAGPIANDASLLTALYRRDPQGLLAVHALPCLHRSIDHFAASAHLDLDALADDDVDDRGVLRALRCAAHGPGGELIEILRADLALVAREYATCHERVVAALLDQSARSVEPFVDEARALLPSLGAAQVELSAALGARGRGFGKRIIVGAPLPWNALDPRVAAVVAMHEAAVEDMSAVIDESGDAIDELRYVTSELGALRQVSRAVTRGSAALCDAHREWLAALDLGPLLDVATARALLAPDLIRALREVPIDRAAHLAAGE